MGLDLVELVMEIEDEFELRIADEDAETLTTPGQVTDYLVRVLGERAARAGVCPGARSFYRLRRQLQSRFGTPRAAVRPAASIGALVPERGRRQWRAIAEAAGLRREPSAWFRPGFPPPELPGGELIRTRAKVAWQRPDGSVDADVVFDQVRLIVSEQLGMPLAEIRRDSHFIRDLGMD